MEEPVRDEDAADGFWGFVTLAEHELRERHGYDTSATALLLTLNRASGMVTYDLEASVHRPRGRSWAVFRVLYALWLGGPYEPHRLAEVTGLSRQGVSNLIRPLVTEGLLTRAPAPYDGRVAILTLTETGRAEIEELFAAHHAREREWAASLDEGERAELVRLLTKLATPETFVPARRS